MAPDIQGAPAPADMDPADLVGLDIDPAGSVPAASDQGLPVASVLEDMDPPALAEQDTGRAGLDPVALDPVASALEHREAPVGFLDG